MAKRLKGIPITLVNFEKVGVNPLGEAEHKEVSKIVDNVLISPTSKEDIINNHELYGKKAVYTLAIPKGDTNQWEDAKVIFFGESWRTIGIPQEGLEHLIPLQWNKKVTVERYE